MSGSRTGKYSVMKRGLTKLKTLKLLYAQKLLQNRLPEFSEK